MPPKPPSTCWVCGKESTQRCSSCARAHLYVPFCSTEHQQLVWPIHKAICGPGKANPLMPPDLSNEELELLDNIKTFRTSDVERPFSVDVGCGVIHYTSHPTVKTTIEQCLGLPVGLHSEFTSLISKWVRENRAGPKYRDGLVSIRSAMMSGATDTAALATKMEFRDAIIRNPYAFAATVECIDEAAGYVMPEPQRTAAIHHAPLLVWLMHALETTPAQCLAQGVTLHHLHSAWRRFAENLVAVSSFSDVEKARAFLCTLYSPLCLSKVAPAGRLHLDYNRITRKIEQFRFA